MKLDNKKVFQTLNPNKVWWPVIIGLGIVFALFYFDPNLTSENLKVVVDASPFFIFLSFVIIFFRDFGYVYRIRELTDRQLTWTRSIYVIIIWEFASAVTPSVVGGTAVAMFILNKEGIKMGKAIAYVMVTTKAKNCNETKRRQKINCGQETTADTGCTHGFTLNVISFNVQPALSHCFGAKALDHTDTRN
jgi:hypothetical protein